MGQKQLREMRNNSHLTPTTFQISSDWQGDDSDFNMQNQNQQTVTGAYINSAMDFTLD